MTIRRTVWSCLLLVIFSPWLPAGTISDNGTPDNLSGHGLTDFLQADDFAVGSVANLTGMVEMAYAYQAPAAGRTVPPRPGSPG